MFDLIKKLGKNVDSVKFRVAFSLIAREGHERNHVLTIPLLLM